MIVDRYNFAAVLDELWEKSLLALDTETTGLRPYHGDTFFSVIINDGTQSFYFNFQGYSEIDPAENLALRPNTIEQLARFCGAREDRLWYLHNAKFDLAVLAGRSIFLRGTVHDSMAVARLLDSTLFPNQFSLDQCASRIGLKKDDLPKKWLLSQGFKKDTLDYTKVPWDIIVPYGEMDAEVTFKLGEHQAAALADLRASVQELGGGYGDPAAVVANERELTRTILAMEARGVCVDRDYCDLATAACAARLGHLSAEFEQLTGKPYSASPLLFKEVFQADLQQWVYGAVTATGQKNPSFASEVLETFSSPAAKAVLGMRRAKSDIDFYRGFYGAGDEDGVIHASFNQHGAATGRFSSSNPNLQNLTESDAEELKAEYVVRRAIVPRPGMVFHMLDYDQMEYRLMLDYAGRAAVETTGVLALIDQVLGGLDVHQATANLAQISRKQAKTTNFAILFGMGTLGLAGSLGVSEARAREIKASIFRAAPEIEIFVNRVIDTAEKRGFIVNWFGRRCLFPDANTAYRAANHVIQGGAADVVKIAMNRVAAALNSYRTQLVMMIHDELVLEGPPEEASRVVPLVKDIMEKVYPHRFLPLTCSVEHSFLSLADKTKGISDERAPRKNLEAV